MEPSGEKPDLLTAGKSMPAVGYRAPEKSIWSEKEKNDRSEWFLIAGFIAVVGFGIMGIGIFGLIFWVSPGPDKMVDIFVCSLAVLMGLFFLTITAIGIAWLSRQKPKVLPQETAEPLAETIQSRTDAIESH